MNAVFALLSFCTFVFCLAGDNSMQKNAESSVIKWADETFEYYDSPRFEDFAMIPTDAYFKLENQVTGLSSYREEMTQSYASGEIRKSKEDFDKSIQRLDRKIDSLQHVLSSFPDKASEYEINFWANIKVSNGLTAYYKHHVKLDTAFAILKTELVSSIGKADEQIEILYKKKRAK